MKKETKLEKICVWKKTAEEDKEKKEKRIPTTTPAEYLEKCHNCKGTENYAHEIYCDTFYPYSK